MRLCIASGLRRRLSAEARGRRTPPSGRALTSIMQQRELLARAHPGKLIALQVGDFYEFMGADARTASTVLDLALGVRLGAPFTGFPVRSADTHLPRLLRAGHQVVLCEQYRDGLRGIFRRRVSRILTPGTVVEGELVPSKSNNFLLAVCLGEKGACYEGYVGDREHQAYSLAWADVGTGELYKQDRLPSGCLVAEIKRIGPAEILVASSDLLGLLRDFKCTLRARGHDTDAQSMIASYVAETNSIASGAAEDAHSVCPGRPEALLMRQPVEMSPTSFMVVDDVDARALDVQHSDVSLYACLDECVTAPGSRLLRHRLQYPSLDVAEIERRLDKVQDFVDDPAMLELARASLKGITDIERGWQRLRLGRASPRDLRSVVQGLGRVFALRQRLLELPGAMQDAELPLPPASLLGLLRELEEEVLEESLPMRVVDGPVIRPGHDAELDELRRGSGPLLHDELHRLIAGYRWSTGLGEQLKACILRSGFFFEIPRRLGPLAPSLPSPSPPGLFIFQHEGATASRYRYRTAELDALYVRAERGTEQAKEHELRVYQRLVGNLLAVFAEHGPAAIRWLAETDVATTAAYLTLRRDYCRPQFVATSPSDDLSSPLPGNVFDGAVCGIATASGAGANSTAVSGPSCTADRHPVLDVSKGRHPVVEWILSRQAKAFTANALRLDEHKGCFVFLTGPNMGGKSTFLRQGALLAVMAQAGLFVPAEHARLTPVDCVLTRIGAADNLAADRSTFMVEMAEAARILGRATRRSLVVVDELGRGTAPAEGVAIAAAVARELQRRRCRCVFATHLLSVKDHLYGAAGGAIFLHSRGKPPSSSGPDASQDFLELDHRIVEGISEEACALGVARIAGLPENVLQEAQLVLDNKLLL